METYYFTFREKDRHPLTDETLKHYWVEIVAASANKARKKMTELFETNWNFQYHEKTFMRYRKCYPKGVYAKYEID